jgi:hypothetical protein
MRLACAAQTVNTKQQTLPSQQAPRADTIRARKASPWTVFWRGGRGPRGGACPDRPEGGVMTDCAAPRSPHRAGATATGLSQAMVAGLIGRPESWLSQALFTEPHAALTVAHASGSCVRRRVAFISVAYEELERHDA